MAALVVGAVGACGPPDPPPRADELPPAPAPGPRDPVPAVPEPATDARPQGHPVFLWVWDEQAPNEQLPAALRKLGATGIQAGRHRSTLELDAQGLDWYEDEAAGKGSLHLRETQWRPAWDAAFAARTEAWPDESARARPTCLRDPELRRSMAAGVRRAARRSVEKGGPGRSRGIVMADEPSATARANPIDWCLCGRCVTAFREAMRERWGGDLAALDAAWGTQHASWQDVRPWTTAAIRKRAFAAPVTKWNLAPWMETRAFQDRTFSETLAYLREEARGIAPGVPCGIAGTQAPSAFGGWDYRRLGRAVDLLEPYDIGLALPISRDVLPRGALLAQTVFPDGADTGLPRWRIWRGVARGANATIVWSSREAVSVAELRAPYGPLIARPLRVLSSAEGPGDALTAAEPLDEGIRIVVSQPSLAIRWMLDSKADGDTWPRRFGSYEAAHSTAIRSREAAWRALAGRGVRFVDARDLDGDHLDGVRLVVLPDVLGLAAREVSALSRFTADGGRIVADVTPGTFDELGRARAAPALDVLLQPGFEGLGGLATLVCGTPPVTARAHDEGAPPIELGLRRLGGRTYLVPVPMWDVLIEETGASVGALPPEPLDVEFRFPGGATHRVRDEITGEDLGEATGWRVKLDPAGAAVYSFR